MKLRTINATKTIVELMWCSLTDSLHLQLCTRAQASRALPSHQTGRKQRI